MLSEKEKENSLNEVRILASIKYVIAFVTVIRNENVVSYKEAFFEEESQSLCIIMEYAEGGDLQSKIASNKKRGEFIPEDEIWRIAIDLLHGLYTLHQLKIVHRDIKCANVFLSADGTAKLGDLNVSKIAKRGMM